jgi:hypothetical protein
MSAIITPAGSPTFPSSLTVPTAGDPVSAGSGTPMRVAFQGLLDGLQFLNLLTGTTGVKRLREVASGAALKALTGMATGDLAFATDTGGVFGLYRFKTESPVGSDIADWVYAATSGTGNWYNVSSTLMALGGAGGTSPRLDASTIRAPFTPPYAPTSTYSATSYGVTAGSGGTLFGPTLSLALETGDVVQIDAAVRMSKVTGAGVGTVEIAIDGSSQTGSARIWDNDTGADYQNLEPMVLYTAVANSTVSVQLKYVATLSTGAPTLSLTQIRALVIRP